MQLSPGKAFAPKISDGHSRQKVHSREGFTPPTGGSRGIVEKKFTSGKDLRLLHGGPGGVPGGSRGGYTPVPGGVVDELRLLHPHLRPISMHLKNASMDMLAINGHSLFENEHFRVISGILAV